MNVLFVCTGNTCRSPMAAALFNKIACERELNVRIESAGIYAAQGEKASKPAVEAMAEYGIDLSSHRSKMLTAELIKESDLILTMTHAHKSMLMTYADGRVYTLNEFAGEAGEITDPFGSGVREYKICAEQMYKLLLKAADKIAD